MADKAEMKTYALGVRTVDCFMQISRNGGDLIRDISRIQGFVGVHPMGNIQIFLYLTPAARRKAYHMLRRKGIMGYVITAPAFVPLSDVPGGTHED